MQRRDQSRMCGNVAAESALIIHPPGICDPVVDRASPGVFNARTAWMETPGVSPMYTMDDDSTAMKHAVVMGIGFGPRVSKMSVAIGEPRQRLGNGLIAFQCGVPGVLPTFCPRFTHGYK